MSLHLAAALPAPRRAGLLAAALALLMFASGPLAAQQPAGDDPVVAKVNGTDIRQSDLDIAESEVGQIPPTLTPAQKKDYLVQFLSDLILVAKAAEARNVADTAEFKKQMEFARRKLLMQDQLEQAADKALTEEAMRKVYDDAIKQIPEEKEVHARHILIRAEADDEKAGAEAKQKIEAVIARLKKGEEFEKVAAEVTEDPSGKANGGDLGWFGKGQMVPEFSDVAFKLEKGQLSEPVKTQFGWHVIKLVDTRDKKPPTFEEVKPQIETFVVRKAQTDMVEGLRKDAKIEKFYKTDEEEKKDGAAAPAQQEPAKQ